MVAAVCTVTNVGRSTKCEEFLDRLSSSSQARRSLLHGVSKGHPITGHEGPEVEERYSFTLPSTSALDGVGGQRHAPAALPPGKTRYPLYRRLGGTQGRSGWVRKISPQPGFDPRTVQPVASGYTDCAIPTLPNTRTRRKLQGSETQQATRPIWVCFSQIVQCD